MSLLQCILLKMRTGKTVKILLAYYFNISVYFVPNYNNYVEVYNVTLHLTPLILFYRRMFAALCSLPSASKLAHSICMGHEPSQG